MNSDVPAILKALGVQPTPQRIAVAEAVLLKEAHPSADQVWAEVKKACPTVSRATVYNTLNLLVKKRMLRTQVLRGGTIVFDRNMEAHHHFIDEESGAIHDIPWDSVEVQQGPGLDGFEILEYQVVMRGRRKRG